MPTLLKSGVNGSCKLFNRKGVKIVFNLSDAQFLLYTFSNCQIWGFRDKSEIVIYTKSGNDFRFCASSTDTDGACTIPHYLPHLLILLLFRFLILHPHTVPIPFLLVNPRVSLCKTTNQPTTVFWMICNNFTIFIQEFDLKWLFLPYFGCNKRF